MSERLAGVVVMKRSFEISYAEKEILNILINIREGFERTIGYLLFALLMTPIGLFMSFLLVYAILTGKLFEISGIDIIILLTATLFFDLIAGMMLFNWLSSNFSKEIIRIDNKEKKITYCKVLFGKGRSREFTYDNVDEIKAEAEPAVKRYERVYPKCYIKYKGEKFRFAYFATMEEGQRLVGKINAFIKKVK